jgi:hypothetical protein
LNPSVASDNDNWICYDLKQSPTHAELGGTPEHPFNKAIHPSMNALQNCCCQFINKQQLHQFN